MLSVCTSMDFFNSLSRDRLFVWCLTPLSILFQLYRGRQCTYPYFIIKRHKVKLTQLRHMTKTNQNIWNHAVENSGKRSWLLAFFNLSPPPSRAMFSKVFFLMAFVPFPNNPLSLRVYSISFLKTL